MSNSFGEWGHGLLGHEDDEQLVWLPDDPRSVTTDAQGRIINWPLAYFSLTRTGLDALLQEIGAERQGDAIQLARARASGDLMLPPLPTTFEDTPDQD